MIYVGIDPGKNGAMAIIYPNKTKLIDYSLPTYVFYLRKFQLEEKEFKVIVEKVHSMPGQGVASTFSFGENFGKIQGILEALEIPYELIPPQVWQRSCGIPPKSDKKAIASIISTIYPKAELYGLRGGLKDGRSDALGIATYLKLKDKDDKY